MKDRLTALRAKLDALSVRERMMVFGAALVLIIFVLHALLLEPLRQREAALSAQISQELKHIAAIDAEIGARVAQFNVDPDQDARAHLTALHADTAALSQSLRAMQSGLIAPERMAPLVESLLKANGKLQLVALKTLPVAVLGGGGPPAAPATGPAPVAAPPAAPSGVSPGLLALTQAAPAVPAAPPVPSVPPAPAAPGAQIASAQPLALLYRHGVEVTVRGNYLDMVDYLTALEAMPERLYWGGAALAVEQYPTSRLTLTVYTLSLDQKWMKL